ncbi:MAG: uroporphyrinogen decarboxylase family protein [Anaerolineales bacterium]
MTFTHRERLQACLNGEGADRPPAALWRHFPVDDQTPETLAAATLNFQKTYDFDLVKVTPASSFCLRDWDVEDIWEGSTEGTRRYTKRVIQKPGDWETLPMLDPSAPHLAGQLACLRQIRAELGPDTPMLQTVFSPLAQAKNLVGGTDLIAHIRKYPEAVVKGLETIALSTQRFVEAALETGIDGIFYAIQQAQAGLLTLDEYKTFGLPFDHMVLEPASELWCNLLHLHGSNVYFEIVSEFSFQIVNWHDRDTPPSLGEAQKVFDGTLCGGLGRDTLVYREQAEVRREARDAIAQTKGGRLILSTGCVVPVIAPHGNIMAARKSVE